MRHRRKTVKLGRDASHRRALLLNLAASLIEHRQIRTTLGKAKALRPVAEKLVTIGKRGVAAAAAASSESDDKKSQELKAQEVFHRRRAAALLGQKEIVQTLFNEIAPASMDRKGGYTRIIKLGQRASDSAPMALVEWVDVSVGEEEEVIAEPAESKEKK